MLAVGATYHFPTRAFWCAHGAADALVGGAGTCAARFRVEDATPHRAREHLRTASLTLLWTAPAHDLVHQFAADLAAAETLHWSRTEEADAELAAVISTALTTKRAWIGYRADDLAVQEHVETLWRLAGAARRALKPGRSTQKSSATVRLLTTVARACSTDWTIVRDVVEWSYAAAFETLLCAQAPLP